MSGREIGLCGLRGGVASELGASSFSQLSCPEGNRKMFTEATSKYVGEYIPEIIAGSKLFSD